MWNDLFDRIKYVNTRLQNDNSCGNWKYSRNQAIIIRSRRSKNVQPFLINPTDFHLSLGWPTETLGRRKTYLGRVGQRGPTCTNVAHHSNMSVTFRVLFENVALMRVRRSRSCFFTCFHVRTQRRTYICTHVLTGACRSKRTNNTNGLTRRFRYCAHVNFVSETVAQSIYTRTNIYYY